MKLNNINEVKELSKDIYKESPNSFNDIKELISQKELNLTKIEQVVLFLEMDYRDHAGLILQEIYRDEDYLDNISLFLRDLSLNHEYFDFLLDPFSLEEKYKNMRFHFEDTYRYYSEEKLAPLLKDSLNENKKIELIKYICEQTSITGKFTDSLNFFYDNKYVETIAEELELKITTFSPRLQNAINNAKGEVRFEVILDENLLHWDLKV